MGLRQRRAPSPVLAPLKTACSLQLGLCLCREGGFCHWFWSFFYCLRNELAEEYWKGGDRVDAPWDALSGVL